MSSSASQRLLSGRAWDDFCETIRQAGHAVDGFDSVADDLDRAEWYRFVTRLVRNGLERYVENCEPTQPRLRDAPWRQSINFQSPDQDHLMAEFPDGSGCYRIRGSRGTVPYFVITAWRAPQPPDFGAQDWAEQGEGGLAAFNPAALQTTAMLKSSDLHYDENGDFEILLSSVRPAGDAAWLPITADCVGVIVRVVYHRREAETPPSMSIERIDVSAVEPTSPAAMSEALAKAGQLVRGYTALVSDWWQRHLQAHPNQIRFSRALYLSNGGVPDRHHGFGMWQKQAGDALVLQFVPPECDYWIFQLCNLWQENLDVYEHGQGYVSKYRAVAESDGCVRIVVSARDPGIGGNWVDSGSHQHGTMSLRLILTQAPPPALTIHRLPLQQLQSEGWSVLEGLSPIASGMLLD